MSGWSKVAVLMGGSSSEREVSLMSGRNVLEALRSRGVNVFAFDPAEREIWRLHDEGFSHAFVMLHGRGGEDGTIQGALEQMRIPYTGSGVAASALAMDKWRTKMVWDAMGIPNADYGVVDEETDWNDVKAKLGLPFMLKAIHEGSSVGIEKVTEENFVKVSELYRNVAKHDATVLAEAFVAGMELTAGILNGQALPLIRIVAPGGNYDFQNKYYSDETQYFCPSGIAPELETAIRADALRAFDLIGCTTWGRLDVILREDGSWAFLEINTVPGMTGHSLVPRAAKVAGIEFDELCLTILEGAHVG